MRNLQKICVFDFETDGVDTSICSPVQIAALIIDPIKLEIIPDSRFNIVLQPDKLEQDPSYDYSDSDVLEFHAKVRNSSKANILSSWQGYQKQSQGWKLFVAYLDMYHSRSKNKSFFSAPIAAGHNINKFDLQIVDRLSKKYQNINKEGKSNLFYPRDVLDLINVLFYWFENSDDLKSFTLDSLRDYLGLDKTGAHDAMKDVEDTASILIRFLKLHRSTSNKVKFRGSFANV